MAGLMKGTVRSYHAADGTAEVELVCGRGVWVTVPVATHLDDRAVADGKRCALLVFDEQNQSDMVLVATYDEGPLMGASTISHSDLDDLDADDHLQYLTEDRLAALEQVIPLAALSADMASEGAVPVVLSGAWGYGDPSVMSWPSAATGKVWTKRSSGAGWERGPWHLIDSAELSSAVTSVTFSSIPSEFVDLLITGVARTDRSAIADTVMLRFNGDTGSNYDRLSVNMRSTGFTNYVARAAPALWVNRCEAASATSQAFSPVWGLIPAYKSTSAYKYLVSGMTFTRAAAGADTDLYLTYSGGCWQSTAAVTSVTLFPSVGPNLVSGCRFYLWGCK